MSLDSYQVPGAPPTPISSKSIKLTTLLARQQQQQQQQNAYFDKENSPVSSAAPSPRLSPIQQPCTDTLIKNSNNSKTHFWRHNTVSTKKKTKTETRAFGFTLSK
jgi:hypothetical protein